MLVVEICFLASSKSATPMSQPEHEDSDSDGWLACVQIVVRDEHADVDVGADTNGNLAACVAAEPIHIPGNVKQRSRLEHHYVAARMRERKAQKRAARLLNESVETITKAVDSINHAAASNVKVVARRARAFLGRTHNPQIALVQSKARGAGTSSLISHKGLLKLAFSKTVRHGDLARQFRIGKSWVPVLKKSVAQAVLQDQSYMLDSLADRLHSCKLVSFSSSLAFDETSHTLLTPAVAGLPQSSHRTAWHVLQTIQHVRWTEEVDGEYKDFSLKLRRSPIPLMSTSAESITDGLFHQPVHDHIDDVVRVGRERADVATHHFDRDGVGTNLKLVSNHATRSIPELPASDRVCANHEINLCESAMLIATSAGMIAELYCICSFFRAGSYFIRILNSIIAFVTESLVVKGWPPPPEAAQFLDELSHYDCTAYLGSVNMSSRQSNRRRGKSKRAGHGDDEAGFHKGYRHRMRLWRRLGKKWNGPLWKGVVHHCKGRECCPSREVLIKEMALSLSLLVFNRMPTIPNKGKWTKTFQCVDWFLRALLVGRALQGVWRRAFSKAASKFRMVRLRNGELEIEECDVEWHRVQAKKMKRADTLLRDKNTPIIVCILALLLEPIRYLVAYYMTISSPARRNGALPPLCDLVSPACAPVYRVLQYYASLCRGRSSRLVLLLQMCECKTFEQWSSNYPGMLIKLRAGTHVAMTWLWRRLWVVDSAMPWQLASLLDDRNTNTQSERVERLFWSPNLGSLDDFFSQRLRSVFERLGVTSLRCRLAQAALRGWAWGVLGSMASVEFLHGRGNQRLWKGMAWDSFAASCICAEAALVFEQSLYSFMQGLALQDDCDDANNVAPRQKRFRKRTALDVFRFELMAGKAFASEKYNPASAQFWAEVRNAFGQLSDERIAEYQRLALCHVRELPLVASHPVPDDAPPLPPPLRAPDEGLGELVLVPAPPAQPLLGPVAHGQLAVDMSVMSALSRGCRDARVFDDMAWEELADADANEYTALSLNSYTRHLTTVGAKGASIKASAKQFVDTHRSQGLHRRDFGPVQYPTPLRASSLDGSAARLNDKLAPALLAYVSAMCPLTKVYNHKMLMVFELSCVDIDDELVKYDLVAFAASGLSKAPLLPARLNFILCDYSNAARDQVQFRYKDRVETPSLSFSRFDIDTGIADMQSQDTVCEAWLRLVVREVAQLVEMRCQRLEYTEVEGDKFHIVGVTDSSLTVPLCGPVEILMDGAKVDAAKASGNDEPAAAADDDWFDLGMASSAPRGDLAGPTDVDELAKFLEMIIEGDEDLAACSEEVSILVAEADLQDNDDDQLDDDGGSDASEAIDERVDLDCFADGDDLEEMSKYIDRFSGPVPLAERMQECLSTCKDIDKAAPIVARFPCEMTHNWKLFTKVDVFGERAELGQIRCTFEGRTLAGQCSQPGHLKCRLLLQIRAGVGGMAEAESVLVKWIIAGYKRDAESHKKLAMEIREARKASLAT